MQQDQLKKLFKQEQIKTMKIKIFESFIKDLEFEEIIDDIVENIPDSDFPSEVGGIRKIKDYFIYIEGWSERCFSNMDLDSREEKVNMAKKLTTKILENQPNLPQNKILRGKNLIYQKFIELPDNQVNYGVSIGFYE